jgi:hypothetical protein
MYELDFEYAFVTACVMCALYVFYTRDVGSLATWRFVLFTAVLSLILSAHRPTSVTDSVVWGAIIGLVYGMGVESATAEVKLLTLFKTTFVGALISFMIFKLRVG